MSGKGQQNNPIDKQAALEWLGLLGFIVAACIVTAIIWFVGGKISPSGGGKTKSTDNSNININGLKRNELQTQEGG